MREILFKAKRLDNGEWISGSLVCFAGGERAILPSDSKAFFSKNKGFICCDTCQDVDPSTVCQYTGLTDKNGKKIFEGDILKGKTRQLYTVEWGNGIAGFLTRGTGVLTSPCMNTGTMLGYEVIGSIHDGEGGQHE